MRAEVIRCLDIVDCSIPFHSAYADNEKYSRVFPDAEIVKCYKHKENKVKYIIQFGISLIIRKNIFDETTISQVKKQYDGYATYYSPHFNSIITKYLGTLFVEKCSADDLLQDLNIMMEKLGLSTEMIISLGMDGPSVNKDFA